MRLATRPLIFFCLSFPALWNWMITLMAYGVILNVSVQHIQYSSIKKSQKPTHTKMPGSAHCCPHCKVPTRALTHRMCLSYTCQLTCSCLSGDSNKGVCMFPPSEKLYMTNKWLWDEWSIVSLHTEMSALLLVTWLVRSLIQSTDFSAQFSFSLCWLCGPWMKRRNRAECWTLFIFPVC